MFQRLATRIQERLSSLLDQYDARLSTVPGYANLPEAARRDLEQNVLRLMVQSLEAGDDTAVITYIHTRAEQALARGFQPEWFQQVVTAAEEIVTPLVETVDEGNFVWRAMSRAQTSAWQIVARERQQAESALRVSEEQYRQAIVAAGAVPYYIDYTTERYRFIGAGIANLLGYPVEEITPTLLGQLIQETVMTGQGSSLMRETAIQETRAGNLTSWNADYRLVDKSGQTVWLHDSSVQIFDEHGKPIGAMGILQDITERKQTEEQEQRTTRYLRAAIDASKELTQAPDLDTLYRRMVELAREKLDIERCGLYLVDESREYMWGAYGTDDQRQTTDERGSQRTTSEFADILTAGPQQLWVVRETPHIFVKDGEQHTLGSGWVAGTVLRDSAGPIGILFNDHALSGQPVDNTQQEALALYCSMAGAIIARKRIEEEVHRSLARRGIQVQTSTEVAQDIATATDLTELFTRVVTLIKDRFNYYHAQLFRYEPNQDAVVLLTGYGEIGQHMLADSHKLRMGRGVVGTAAATGQSILAADVRQDADWQPNPHLPDTRGELAVPIKWRDQVLGILDVQSDQPNALTDDDRLLLEGLCGQIAIALESTRLLEQLRRNEAQLSEALKIAKLGYWEYDVEKDLFLFNDQFYSIFHTTAKQAGGYQISSAQYAQQFVHPDDLSMVGGEIERALNSTDRHYNRQLEHRILYADGGVGYISVNVNIDRDEQGRILRYYGANQDITQSKLAEQTLRETEERFRAIAETSPIPLLISRAADGMVLYGNDHLGETFGIPIANLIGRQTPDFYVDAADRPPLLTQLKRDGMLRDYELHVKRADGTPFWVLVSMRPMIFDGQAALLAAFYDITERRQIEEALRRNEAELSEALKIAKLAYWEYDVEKDLFLFNDQFYSIFHTTAKQAGGYQISSAQYAQQFVHPDDLSMVGGEIEKALNSTDRHYNRQLEHRVLFADGGVGYISVNVNIDRDEQGNILRYYGANQDITLQKLAELDLRKFKLGMERSSAAIFITDTTGVITYVNPAFEKVYGFAPEEAIGQTPRILKSGFIPQEQYQHFWGALLAGQTVAGEIINKAKDGRLVPVQGSNSAIEDEQGNILGFLAVHTDISERKQVEQELSRFKQGLEQASDAVFMTDVDGQITYVNPAFERIYGYSSEEALGRTPRILKSGQLSQEFYQHFWQTLLNKQSISGEKPNRTKDGRVIIIEDSNSPIVDSAGNLLGFLSTHRDITERKRTEQRVEDTLHETERLYAAVSHESWQTYRQTEQLPAGYRFDQTLIQPAEQLWEPEITRAVKEQVLTTAYSEQRAVAVAPVSVRGEIIGALGVYDDPDQPLSKDDLQLIEAVSEQVALALESARLFEQTQRDAERESTINRVTTRIRNARSVDEVLSIAAQELRQATRTSRSVVEIMPDADQPIHNGNGEGVKA